MIFHFKRFLGGVAERGGCCSAAPKSQEARNERLPTDFLEPRDAELFKPNLRCHFYSTENSEEPLTGKTTPGRGPTRTGSSFHHSFSGSRPLLITPLTVALHTFRLQRNSKRNKLSTLPQPTAIVCSHYWKPILSTNCGYERKNQHALAKVSSPS
jgi:hypothetical protein